MDFQKSNSKITIGSLELYKSNYRHNFLIIFIPFVGFLVSVFLIIKGKVGSWEIILLTLMYVITAFGIEVGYHRYFSHKSFETNSFFRLLLAILGSMAAQAPIIYWVSNHRRHHIYSDKSDDPHSPYISENGKISNILAGFWHSHIGWLFNHRIPSTFYFAKDLLKDPLINFVNRNYIYWVFLGIIIPTIIGVIITRSWSGALGGFLWGGLVRIFLVEQGIFSVNSICHMFGNRPFNTDDQSTNNIWLAIPTLGGSWHNNHHAFPSSLKAGLKWWQLDFSALIILILSKIGLVWNLNIPTVKMIEEKLDKNLMSKNFVALKPD